MNLVLFSPEDRLSANCIKLTDGRLRHLQEVLAASPGDRLRVGEINGDMGSAELLSIDDDNAVLQVELGQAPPAKLTITLILALPRPKMLRRILRMVAELGVPELHLVNSYRVEKSYWQSPALAPANVTRYFLEGLQQSRDTVLPTLQLHKRFKPFVEDDLPAMLAGSTALLAHPGEFAACPIGCTGATVLLVGPEGGFIPYEVDLLQAAGCQAISLGARILRVENAVSSLLAKLGHEVQQKQ